ncbi:hypothetical protein NCTGTJJY_CDS0154 [Serratia phage 92A1]|nr:hypothetical protein NCTGTJJY_CDS0154 [Serratia phage 92A1]
MGDFLLVVLYCALGWCFVMVAVHELVGEFEWTKAGIEWIRFSGGQRWLDKNLRIAEESFKHYGWVLEWSSYHYDNETSFKLYLDRDTADHTRSKLTIAGFQTGFNLKNLKDLKKLIKELKKSKEPNMVLIQRLPKINAKLTTDGKQLLF